MRMRIQTGSPDEAHDWLRRAYSDHTVRLSGRTGAFRFSHQVAECGPLRVGVCRHTMTLEGRWQPLGNTLLFSHLLQGAFTVRSSDAEVVARPGDVLGYDPDVVMDTAWSDIRVAQVRIDRAAADRVAAETAGADHGPVPVTWQLGRPPNEARARHWRRLMRYVSADVLSEPEVVDSPLVLRAVQRHVIVTALQTFPNSTLAGPDAPAGRAAPAAVRRALDFIDEHAAGDIDLTAIADAAHVGPRALQRAFRRTLDATPLEHLRSVRLDRAHADLVAADPGVDTVAAIALRWGFGHAGRFAKDYRARFRRSPSDTLRG